MDFVSASDAQGRLVCCASKHESCSIDAQELFCSDLYIAQELELLEQRGQGIKTKAETQAKYGW
jgi:hypothetical protein